MKFILRTILIIFTLLSFTGLSAQEGVKLGRTVMGAAGETFRTGDKVYSFTIGEPVIGTAGYGTGYYTQGFQQPVDDPPITYKTFTEPETCAGMGDGAGFITDIRGCPDNNYIIDWDDGTMGTTLQSVNAGWHYFTISGCDKTVRDSILIGLENENPCQLIFYTAFSPNGDGINDTWVIDNITLPQFSINDIDFYNIWGQHIRSFANYDNAEQVWEGKNKKGIDLPAGTYYFVLKINSKTYSGYIELTR